jgi:hypothetical protein
MTYEYNHYEHPSSRDLIHSFAAIMAEIPAWIERQPIMLEETK